MSIARQVLILFSFAATQSRQKQLSARIIRAGIAWLLLTGTMAGLATGCLDRPVVKAEPSTSNVFVDQIRQTSVDKIDLLFMVDNSVSMSDKQEILQDAVPVLVNRLIEPICVDGLGKAVVPAESSRDGRCQKGQPEFDPIGDIHIGIVSSSLGSHGGDICNDRPNRDDKARLVATMRPGFDLSKTWDNSGFLAWDTAGTANNPAGTNDAKALTDAFQDMIVATSEQGCGLEASLESWYRFLIDPEPPASVAIVNGDSSRGSSLTQKNGQLVLDANGQTTCTGCDETVLAQRKAFLRPDSLVAIVMLSDENDCSVRDDNKGWFVSSNSSNGQSVRMPRATAACDTNPNDVCCRSCASGEASPPAGCISLAADPTCGAHPTWDANGDAPNLRCYKQRERFGFDMLYETSRYVDALKSPTIRLQSTGLEVRNPLFASPDSAKAPRDPSLVFLAGIVGVPWQDIATGESLTGSGLTYLTADELATEGRWLALIGDPDANPPVAPTDPFMIETTGNPTARSGSNPFAPGEKIVPFSSTDPQANRINGHEQNVPSDPSDDLQFACTFKRKTPKTCAASDSACDCSPGPNGDNSKLQAASSPLCQGGANINTQTYAKAYPGTRHLQVLKGLGSNAIVASICPKVTESDNPASDPNYGYNPAVGAIIERLKVALTGKCLPRPLQPDAEGQVQCKVIEAQEQGCNCATSGRAPTDDKILGAVRAQLKSSGNCGVMGRKACESWCTCEIKQAVGADLTKCQSNEQPDVPGYCYVNKALDKGQLTDKCPSNTPQLLRFAETDGVKTPAQDSVAFIACIGAPVGAGAGSSAGASPM